MSIEFFTSPIAGFIVAAFLVIVYLGMVAIKKRPAKLENAVSIVLGGGGIIASIRIGYLAIFESSLSLTGIDQTYLFIGALAVCWVSVIQIIHALKR